MLGLCACAYSCLIQHGSGKRSQAPLSSQKSDASQQLLPGNNNNFNNAAGGITLMAQLSQSCLGQFMSMPKL